MSGFGYVTLDAEQVEPVDLCEVFHSTVYWTGQKDVCFNAGTEEEPLFQILEAMYSAWPRVGSQWCWHPWVAWIC